jgi:hypothetical protein
MKHEAIYNLYSTVKKIIEDKNGNLTAYDANENEVSIDIINVNIKAEELELAEQAKEANAITKKASGKQKLLDLGLSEEEVKALIGV